MNSTRFASRTVLSVALSLAMSATLSACGASTDTAPPAPSATTDAATTDAATADAATADATADASTWPRTVTIALDGPGLDLATGALSRDGDIALNTGRVIDLIARGGVEALCPVGAQPSLDAIPTATDACRTYQNAWVSRVGVLQYSASATNSSVGTSLLVRDAGRATYRLRIVRDETSYARTSITVEYAPLP